MSAIAERRTRRVARGTSINAGELSHTSTNQPAPLSALEEAVLVVSTGLTGLTTHDGPLVMADGRPELGTPFLNVLARSGSSADNAQATSFFLINDEGTWLIRRPGELKDHALLRELPPRWEDWREADWLALAAAMKRKLYDTRLDFPRRYPFYLGWNKQMSNRPGTTILLPVVDCTRALINILLILLSEPDGERPVFVDDWQEFQPKNPEDLAAWLAVKLGFVDKEVPYQPIGGIAWVRSGFLNPEINIPLGLAHTMRVDYEAFFLVQNLMLVGQGMGLGGWIHASVFPPFIFQRDPSKGWLGLGFRMHTPEKTWHHRWPPVPSTQPNPVGIDGILEGLCPPYVSNMDEAVERVLEEKYGPSGTYGDRDTFARSYRERGMADRFLERAAPYTKEAIRYTKEVCRYIHETYGRFPAHVDAFYLPGVWLQFSHLELEYYRRFYNPQFFSRQEALDGAWTPPESR
jgi:hypothetical protein